MTRTEKIRALLADYTRIQNTGNMRQSGALLPEIVETLIEMIEARPPGPGRRPREVEDGVSKTFDQKP